LVRSFSFFDQDSRRLRTNAELKSKAKKSSQHWLLLHRNAEEKRQERKKKKEKEKDGRLPLGKFPAGGEKEMRNGWWSRVWEEGGEARTEPPFVAFGATGRENLER
jgi:hypothetical protein